MHPNSRETAIEILLAFRANTLVPSEEAVPTSPLIAAVQQLDCDLVKKMLDAKNRFLHTTVLSYQKEAQVAVSEQLALAFFRLMKTPRLVRIAMGVNDYNASYLKLVQFLIKQGIAKKLRLYNQSLIHLVLHVIMEIMRQLRLWSTCPLRFNINFIAH